MAQLRVKPWIGAVTVSHPDTGQFITPDRSTYYRSDDPLVTAHRWLFGTDEEIAKGYDEATAPTTEVSLDQPPKRGRK